LYTKRLELKLEKEYNDEVKTKAPYITFYYVKTDQKNYHLAIEIEAEDEKSHMLYLLCSNIHGISGNNICVDNSDKVLLLQATELNPFQSEEWVLEAEDRYNAILKESSEGLYSNEFNKFDQKKCVICLIKFTEGQRTRVVIERKKSVDVPAHFP